MSIMLKPGYAPEEQYRTHGEQGPWTDVYALCATMYRCITGQIPPESMERTYQDQLKPISDFQQDCPAEVEYVIQKGLGVYKNERWQSMEELYESLYSGQTVTKEEPSPTQNNHTAKENPHVKNMQYYPRKDSEKENGILPVIVVVLGVILLVLLAVFGVKYYNLKYKDQSDSTEKTAQISSDLATIPTEIQMAAADPENEKLADDEFSDTEQYIHSCMEMQKRREV